MAGQDEPAAGVVLDSLEQLLAPLDEQVWKKKRDEDFPALRSWGALLDFRAELVVAAEFHRANVPYALGNTKVSNPDFLLDAYGLGLEVNSKSPSGLTDLCEEIEELLHRHHPSAGALITASVYPSRMTGDNITLVRKHVASALEAADGAAVTPLTVVVKDSKNVTDVHLTVALTDQGSVNWQVEAGDLTVPLGSAEYAAVEAGRSPAKAKQGCAMPGRVMLAVDLSRYGAAWMRPAWVWAGRLARAIPADFPFGALAVFRQSIEYPGILQPAVGIASHLPAEDQDRFRRLCADLSWAASA
ncbi:hypothetical protein ABZW30_23330 [Kitasatospora sp. NPDC004669]|uniref:hypothetical protein n=1 Tax=Kitasatospora sp. NPDC004669 TaxID=3154555 RepID=UPI0033A31EC1